MADTTTGLGVKTLTGEIVDANIAKYGGTSTTLGQKAMTASIPVVLASDQSAVAVTVSGVALDSHLTNVQVVDNAGFTDGTTSLEMAGYIFDEVAGTALTENDAAAARVDSKRAQVFVGEDATTRGQRWAISSAGALAANLTQLLGSALITAGVTGVMAMGGGLAHDAAGAALLPVGTAAFASAAAPTAVSADGDVVKLWALRNGAQVVNLASGGTLITVGQTTMSASLPVAIASDQTAVPSNITQVSGATQSATNPLFVRLTDGAAAYSASSTAPSSPQTATVTSSALGAGANTTLNGTTIANGTTGRLAGVDVTSTAACKWELQSIDGSSVATTRVVIMTPAYGAFQWRAPFSTYITRAGAAANTKFAVKVTNLDTVAADVYATIMNDVV